MTAEHSPHADETLDHGPDTGADTHLDSELDSDLDSVVDEAQDAIREARARLGEVPADVVVTNHVMGLYELGAIHLSAEPPRLSEAALAIDAMACLVEGLGDRIGADAPTMAEALSNIRLAFVQIKSAQGG